MEGHIHIESSILSPKEFARTVLSHGTTSVICDPHEIANVSGLTGIQYFLDESADLPCQIFMMAPSCLPATPLENSGAIPDADNIKQICYSSRVIGISEMMDFSGVLFEDEEVLKKLQLAQQIGLPVDGHAPGLNGKGPPSMYRYWYSIGS